MIYAIHEHELRPGADEVAYVQDVAAALAQMKVPGLLYAHHLKGVRGERSGKYAILWIFASEAALAENFGTPDNRQWPADWLHYENVILACYLDRHPDTIDYTDYRPLHKFTYAHD